MSIQDNVAARLAAETVVQLACDEALQCDTDAAFEHYWMCVLKLIQHVVPKDQWPQRIVQAPVVPMTPAECAKFEVTCVQFGKHVGDCVGSVPLEYLEWLDSQYDFRQQLRRYLASKQVQRHMVVDEEDD